MASHYGTHQKSHFGGGGPTLTLLPALLLFHACSITELQGEDDQQLTLVTLM